MWKKVDRGIQWARPLEKVSLKGTKNEWRRASNFSLGNQEEHQISSGPGRYRDLLSLFVSTPCEASEVVTGGARLTRSSQYVAQEQPCRPWFYIKALLICLPSEFLAINFGNCLAGLFHTFSPFNCIYFSRLSLYVLFLSQFQFEALCLAAFLHHKSPITVLKKSADATKGSAPCQTSIWRKLSAAVAAPSPGYIAVDAKPVSSPLIESCARPALMFILSGTEGSAGSTVKDRSFVTSKVSRSLQTGHLMAVHAYGLHVFLLPAWVHQKSASSMSSYGVAQLMASWVS